MLDTIIWLGGYSFNSWGVPARINGGGRQQLVVHQLIGGARVIETLGWNADDVCFRGRLRGLAASVEVRLLETLARSGQPVVFSYWSNRYQVVVRSFRWCFERYYEISYELDLTVLADLTQDAWQVLSTTLDEAFGADLLLVSSVSLGLPALATTLTLVSSAQAAVGVLQGASAVTLLPVAGAVQTSLGAAQAMQATLDAASPVGAAGGVVAGGDPQVLAASLAGQATGYQNLASATQASAVLTRMQMNLTEAAP